MLHPQYEAERASWIGSAWTADAPREAPLATRVPVRTTFRDSQGAPVRWTWVTLQTYHHGSWHNIQRRATDRNGKVSTSLWLRRDIKVRFVPERDSPPNAEPSRAGRIDARRADTVVRLGGRDRARRGSLVRLSVRWRSEDGRLVSGPSSLWSRQRGADRWSRIRTGCAHGARRATRFVPTAAGGGTATGTTIAWSLPPTGDFRSLPASGSGHTTAPTRSLTTCSSRGSPLTPTDRRGSDHSWPQDPRRHGRRPGRRQYVRRADRRRTPGPGTCRHSRGAAVRR
jgi:hypothetical protein